MTTTAEPHLRLLLDKAAVAQVLSVSERTVTRLLGRGELIRCQVGGLTRVHVDDVRAFAKAARRECEWD